MQETGIDAFLDRLKAGGASSPEGKHWAAFHDLLAHHAQRAGADRPPMPLILAASGESDDAKHRRLAEQLRWAEANHFLQEALQFLEALEPDQWNRGSAEAWHRTSYW